MKSSAVALCATLAAATSAQAADASAPLVDTLVVTAPAASTTQAIASADIEPATRPDAAAFIARQPGAALVNNGALSGQVQIRGLFGERILVRINGQGFATGGPNAMDPAMHYAPMALVERIEIARGASPVRDGPGLGGGMNAILRQVRFAESEALSPSLDVSTQYRSADDSGAIGLVAGLASRDLRLGLSASRERGENLRFPGGRVADTAYQRSVLGVHAGLRRAGGEYSFEYRRQDTGRSGNPPFAMDIIYFHTDFARAGYDGELTNGVKLAAHVNYTGVTHRMNNFELRPAPSAAMTRQTDTYADTLGGDISVRIGEERRHVRIGADFEEIEKGYRLYNPLSPAFFIYPLDHARSRRIGGFVEWRSGAGPLASELGLRVDRHEAKADAPRVGPGVPAGPVGLAGTFARADRSWEGTTLDASWRLWVDAGPFVPRLTLAHKTRAPSLIERFSWLPTEASGGLADGNIYVGSPGLKPERAWIAEAGLDWTGTRAYARPVVYYRRIADFIQGVPFDTTPGLINSPVEAVAQANGDSTPLRFANTSAEIWGADVSFGLDLAGPLRLDGVASYVRGRRADLRDNLYRISPPNARVALTWDAGAWSVSGEVQATAAQKKVSATNSEAQSDGYVLANLYGYWVIREGVRLDVGVENLLDRRYEDHLAGYNRVSGSDVPLGARLPGAGRSAFLRLRWTYP